MDDNDTAPDFIGALNAEFGLAQTDDAATPAPSADGGADDNAAAEPATQETPQEQTPADDVAKPSTDEPAAKPEDAPVQPQPSAKPAETPEETANRNQEEAAEASKYATPEDVKQAMREYNQETAQRVNQIHDAREEIISKLHPEGIDRTIYDSDGNAIKTAQDIVDRGLLKDNGDPYSYEEAASFVLEANRTMTENVEKLNDWADSIAEQNISLVESNQRVMEQWGDTLKAMPEVAQKLAETYITTQLTFDKSGSYITNMSMTPEDFYTLTMAPYKELGSALAAKAQLESDQKNQAAVNEQAERNGLPPQRGTSETKANTGNPMLDALVDELKKG